MSINRKIILTAAIGIAFGVSSCKKYLNVNTNPNVSQTATVQTLLPAAQLYVGTSLGVDLEIAGSFWAQYWTESPNASQYRIYDTYNPGQDVFSTAWTNLYRANENFFQLYKLADSLKDKQYKAIALIMQAYTFQLITDGWGDVPFSQALKGQFADGHIINPKYDSQDSIYAGIIATIDSANKLISTTDPVHPGADDLIYGGDMSKWQKFSNTLMLKVLLHESLKNPAAAAAITAFYATNPTFIGTGDDAFIAYGFSTANKNPLYAEESSTTLGGTQNLVGSTTAIDSLNSNGDPRTYIFYAYIPAVGLPVGVQQGFTGSLAAGSFSYVNVYVAGDAQNINATKAFSSSNAPVNILTSWESYFMQAEVTVKGWGTTPGMSDVDLFYAGINASFTYYAKQLTDIYGTPATSTIDSDYLTGVVNGGTPGYWTVYPAGGSTAAKLRFIITQKWFAMCGNQGFEAWTEWRRTGYPDFVTTIQSLGAGSLPKPRRFLYPTSESTVNASYPGLAPIASPVWWDIL